MPLDYSIDVKGEEKVQRKLKALLNLDRAIGNGLQNYMHDLENNVTPYPPGTQANNPPGINGRWYVRGFGTRTVTGKAYPTSERLSSRWEFKVQRSATGYRGIIKNTASYAQYVQGLKQVGFHAARGWKRVDKEIRRTFGDLKSELVKEIRRELNR